MRLLNRPMASWEKAIDRLGTDARMRLDDEAAALATKAARLSAYVSRRMSGGKHSDAVAAQNRAASKVRQALGFTYKDSKISF